MAVRYSELSLDDQIDLSRLVAARAREEQFLEWTSQGHIGEIEVEHNGRSVMIKIEVEGDWDDWYPISVRYPIRGETEWSCPTADD